MEKFLDKILLIPEDLSPSKDNLKIEGVFNPAAIRDKTGKIILYVRVAEASLKKNKDNNIKKEQQNLIYLKDGTCRLRTNSHFRKIVLDKEGLIVKKIEKTPIFKGIKNDSDCGVEDARLIQMDNQYLMTYVSVSIYGGVSTSLAISKDLTNWSRKGIIFRKENKDVVIFPEKINGKYVALHRPRGIIEFSKPSIWISYSPDLVYWGREKSIIEPQDNSWDSDWIGAGCPPIKTKKGWLLIYHGAVKIKRKMIYSVGAALLDFKNPEKVIARSPKNKPLIIPNKWYEKKGFVNNVVFPTGAVLDLDGKHLLIYCGGADKFTSVKKILIEDIFNQMELKK